MPTADSIDDPSAQPTSWRRAARVLAEWMILGAIFLAFGGWLSDGRAVFAPWRDAFASAAWIFDALTLFAILSLFFYQRRRRRHRHATDSRRERRLAEQMLTASEARLHAVFDASPDSLLICDAQGIIVMLNRQVECLLGFTVAELIGQPIEGLVPQGFRNAHPGLREAFAASPIARRMGRGRVVKALRKDGGECEVEISLSRIQTDHGVFFASALRDITEQSRAENAVKESEQRFQQMLDSMREGYMVIGFDWRYIYVNESAALHGRQERAALIGRKMTEIYPGIEQSEIFHTYRKVMEDRILQQCEASYVFADGKTGWYDFRIAPAKDGISILSVEITERKNAQNEARKLAFFDQLTGLPNRTLLMDRLEQAMAVNARNDTCGAVLFIDLDHFKTLNDTMGHDKGDLLLQQAAQRLLQCVRDIDTVARLGGDEFVVVLGSLQGTVQEAAAQTEIVGVKILAALCGAYRLGDIDHRSTASIGATVFSGSQTAIDDLLKQADLAMYKSKDAGRNALRFFDPAMQTAVMERAALEAGLRAAIGQKQFFLHYQAQVLRGGRIVGAEVLVRWQHPQRGVVSPADFIPLAEETGLILPLGHWVLETACAQLANWADRPGMAHLTISVNVSVHQFRQPDFVGQVLAVLQKTGADPHLLKLELTESMLVDNALEIIGKMSALKTCGVRFSLDDFGTGFSSLSYLKKLPLDQLKIDQSFVRDIITDRNDSAIAKTIVALATSLGLGVIAEGVETQAQQDFLAKLGCHSYQGYFFSRPLPLEDFERLHALAECAA